MKKTTADTTATRTTPPTVTAMMTDVELLSSDVTESLSSRVPLRETERPVSSEEISHLYVSPPETKESGGYAFHR